MGHPAGMRLHLPSEVRRIADNYNHLFEQPTLFYAVCHYDCCVAGHVDAWQVNCAWAFVAIRVRAFADPSNDQYRLLRFRRFML